MRIIPRYKLILG